MQTRLPNPVRFALAIVFGLACLLIQAAVWAQSPDAMIQAVMEVQDRHTDRLLGIPGIVGIAITILPDGQPALKVLTRDRAAARALPASLDGIPVVVEVVGDIRALAFTIKYNPPVPVGISIGNIEECAAGTHGAVVTKNGNDYVLSNNHVLARQNNAKVGEDIQQPGRFDSIPQCDVGFPTHIADLSEKKDIKFSFLGLSGDNRIDAAIASLKGVKGIDYTCETEPTCGYTPATTPVPPSMPMNVKKCGRTTMLTRGRVTGLNATVRVNYGGTPPKFARFKGQVQFSNISQAGDSGSLIVEDATNKPVALLFAGSAKTTIGNPIGDVLSNFGVSICGL
jgi:hypothetical protein